MHTIGEKKNTNGWDEYRALVLDSLNTIKKVQDEQAECLKDLAVEIAVLKVKAGLYGTIGASIPIGIAVALKQFS